MPLGLQDVHRVARLARLELTDQEAEVQRRRINELMEQFQALSDLAIAGIEPTAHCTPLQADLRDDVARPSLPRDALLEGAPEAQDGGFVVPQILEAS